MPPAAAALGLDPRPGAFTTRVTGATARIGDDGWVYLDDKAGQLVACRPTAAEWAELARRDRRVVLAIGYAPMPTGMRIDTYTDQLLKSGQLALGLVALA